MLHPMKYGLGKNAKEGEKKKPEEQFNIILVNHFIFI